MRQNAEGAKNRTDYSRAATVGLVRAISTLALRRDGRIVHCKTANAISPYLRHIMDPIVVVSLWVIQGRIRVPDWIFSYLPAWKLTTRTTIKLLSISNDWRHVPLSVRKSWNFRTISLSGLRVYYLFNRVEKVLLLSTVMKTVVTICWTVRNASCVK